MERRSNPPPAPELLLLLLWVVEHVNARVAVVRKRTGGRRKSDSSKRPEQRPASLQAVVKAALDQLEDDKQRWTMSPLLELLREAKLEPSRDREAFAKIRRLIEEHLRPPPRGAGPSLPESYRVNYTLWACGSPPDLATVELMPQLVGSAPSRIGTVRLGTVEEVIDPVDMLMAYTQRVLGTPGRQVDHVVQRAINNCFDLHFKQHQTRLAGLCDTLNQLCYRSRVVSRAQAQAAKVPLLGIRTFVDIIRRVVAPEAGGSALKHSLGYFILLRFCRLLHVRSLWLQPSLQNNLEAQHLFNERHRVGVTLLEPLRQSFVRCRMFGALSGIEGLNDVLGGGLLPRLGLGRAFVISGEAGAGKTAMSIHMMADMAARGRLAIYCSLEEPYDNLLYRMESFGLLDRERYRVGFVTEDRPLEAVLMEHKKDYDDGKGLFLFLDMAHDMLQTLGSIANVVRRVAPRWHKSTAIVIDSFDALEFDPRHPESPRERRHWLKRLVQAVERGPYWGILLCEQSSPSLVPLQHLSDTAIELAPDAVTGQRSFRITKCRLQHFYGGFHTAVLRDGRGMEVVPSLGAVRSMIEYRTPSALSEKRVIPLPPALRDALPISALREKSSTLIWGDRGCGKGSFWTSLLTEDSCSIVELPSDAPRPTPQPHWAPQPAHPPGASLVLSFRTPATKFRQRLRALPALSDRWSAGIVPVLRWYSAGTHLTGADVVRDLRRVLHEQHAASSPLERVVFDEIDAIPTLFPALAADDSFWPAVMELLAAEVVSSFYVMSADKSAHGIAQALEPSMDYVFEFRYGRRDHNERPASTWQGPHISVRKHAEPDHERDHVRVPIRVCPSGAIELAPPRGDASREGLVALSIANVTFACDNPDALATFWAAALGYKREPSPPGVAIVSDPSGRGPRLFFERKAKQVGEPQPIHLDLFAPADIEAEATRLEGLGASRVERRSETASASIAEWLAMKDPEGNGFRIQG